MNKILMLAGALGFALASAASATTISGVTSGEFTGVVNGFNVDGSGDTAVWPDDNDGFKLCWYGVCHFETGQSTLTIETFNFSENVGSAGGTIDIGQINWHNAASRSNPGIGFPGTDPEFTLNAELDLSFTDPVIAGPYSEVVAFDVTNTLNNPADIIDSSALAIGGIDFGGLPLTIGDRDIIGFSFYLLDDTYSSYDATTGVWTLDEHKSASLRLVAEVAPVPLPAAGWMLIAGLGGMAALRRRKKSQAA